VGSGIGAEVVDAEIDTHQAYCVPVSPFFAMAGMQILTEVERLVGDGRSAGQMNQREDERKRRG